MAAPYTRRFPGGFVDKPAVTTPIEAAFLNALEDALIQLLGDTPVADEVGVWVGGAGGGLVYQKITNAQIAVGAAIDKSKLAALNIVDADIAGAAAIAKSKLGPLNITDADIQATAAIAISKLAGYPNDATKFLRGNGSWTSFVGAKVTTTGSQTPATGTDTAIQFDTEGAGGFDTDGFHDNVTNNTRLTIPAGKGGKYLINFVATFDGNATGVRDVWIRKNGSDANLVTRAGYNRQTASASGNTMATTVVLDLAAGDYIEVMVVQTSGVGLPIGNGAQLRPVAEIVKLD